MRKTGLVLLLISICFALPSFGWQFVDSINFEKLDSGIVVFDPDNLSREDLKRIKSSGVTPLAWLNLSEIEDWRVISVEAKEKEYAFQVKSSPNDLKLAKFYSSDFRLIAESRVREYLIKGFSGIVFANVGFYGLVSNNPVNRSEMWRLIENLAKQAGDLSTDPLLLIHNGVDFVEELKESKNVDGLLTHGLFNTLRGRHVHEYQRKEVLKKLKPLLGKGKLILTAEMTHASKQREFVARTCKKAGVDFSFQKLPLKMKRRTIDDFKK